MNLDLLQNFCVVLVLPKHPGNVGAVARAMGTMGFSDLRIVDDRGQGGLGLHQKEEAIARACDSADILAQSRTFPDLARALADTTFAVGTSARRRENLTPLSPREVARDVAGKAVHGRVALVFGREDEGLTIEELARCHALVRIPTAPKRSSLNLSHAVQLVAYEVMLAVAQPSEAAMPPPASQEERDALFSHAGRALRAIGAFPPQLMERKLRYLRQVLDRSQPTTSELHFLHGMFRQMEWVVSRWVRGQRPPANWSGGLPEGEGSEES